MEVTHLTESDLSYTDFAEHGVLGRGLFLLELITINPSLSITEISKATKIPKATVYRSLNTLRSLGYLQQDPQTQRYSLSTKILHLAAAMLKNLDIREKALPLMRNLVQLSGETANLFILEQNHAVCIEQVPSNQAIRLLTEVGARNPLHCGASPKLLLALLPAEKRQRIIDETLATGGLTCYTNETPCDKEQLLAILETIRQQKYCVSRGEVDVGAVGIAAPVYNAHGKIVASLSLSGPALRITEDRETELIQLVVQTAQELSEELGYIK